MARRADPLNPLADTRRAIDLVTGRNSIMRRFEETQRMIDMATGRNSAMKWFETHQRLMDTVTGRNSPFKYMEDQRRLIDMLTGANSPFNQTQRMSELVDMVSGHNKFMAMAGVSESLAAISTRPEFSSLIEAATAPRPAWIDIFDSIGVDVSDEAAAEFEAAATDADMVDGDVPWVEKLPPARQLVLAAALVEVLNSMNDLAGDFGENQIPTAYVHAAKLIFALLTVLIALVDDVSRD